MTLNIIRFDSVDQYNQTFGYTPVNNGIAVIDTRNAKKKYNHYIAQYGIYAVFLKTGGMCSLLYGRQKYDYTKGTVVCFNPGKQTEVDIVDENQAPTAIGLLFNKDFIAGTPLEKSLMHYHFLNYLPKEALHLNDNEFKYIQDQISEVNGLLSNNISAEIKSKILTLITNILKHINHYYNRQFSARSPYHHDIVNRFLELLNEYMSTDKGFTEGIPSVAYFADKVFLSAGYFGDLIKKETGISAQKIIQKKLVETAMKYLTNTDSSINNIAEHLGFQYPQHFTRMFKNITGISPKTYRTKHISEI